MTDIKSGLYILYKLYEYSDLKGMSINDFIVNLVSDSVFNTDSFNLSGIDSDINKFSKILDMLIEKGFIEKLYNTNENKFIIKLNSSSEKINLLIGQFKTVINYVKMHYDQFTYSNNIQMDLIMSMCKLDIECKEENEDEGDDVDFNPSRVLEYLRVKKNFNKIKEEKMSQMIDCEDDADTDTNTDDLEEDDADDDVDDENRIVEVKSSNGVDLYYVDTHQWTCTCPSYLYSLYVPPKCKHIEQVLKSSP